MTTSTIIDVRSLPIVKKIIREAEASILEATGRKTELLIVGANNNADAYLSKRNVIRDVVCSYYDVKWENVIKKTRRTEYVEPRHAYIYLCCTRLFLSLKVLQVDCGYAEHTAVIHARNKIADYVETNQPEGVRVKQIIELLNQHEANEVEANTK